MALRPNVGIPSGQLLPLDSTFGLHPALGALKPLYDAGTFGIVHAVGMADPDRSHFSAMEELERAAPNTSVRTGWIDRVLGRRQESSVFQGVQMGSGLPGDRLPRSVPRACHVVDRRLRALGRVRR